MDLVVVRWMPAGVTPIDGDFTAAPVGLIEKYERFDQAMIEASRRLNRDAYLAWVKAGGRIYSPAEIATESRVYANRT